MTTLLVARFSRLSLPGLTRQSIFVAKKLDGRVKPGHDGLLGGSACQ
jgi:hypothetical protein